MLGLVIHTRRKFQTPDMLNAFAMKSSLFSRNVAWFLQVKHTLARVIPLLIWSIHSVFFNFRFETNMATPYNALQNTRKSRNDFFLVHNAHLTLAWRWKKKKQIRQLKKHVCSSKFPNLALTEITITLLNLTSRTDNSKPGFNTIWKGLWPSLTDSIRQIHFVRVLFHIIHFSMRLYRFSVFLYWIWRRFFNQDFAFILWVLGSLMTCVLMVSSLRLSACFIFDKRAWVIYCSLS